MLNIHYNNFVLIFIMLEYSNEIHSYVMFKKYASYNPHVKYKMSLKSDTTLIMSPTK